MNTGTSAFLCRRQSAYQQEEKCARMEPVRGLCEKKDEEGRSFYL